LPLSPGCKGALLKAGIKKAEDLLRYSRADLCKKGLAISEALEVEELLAACGIFFRGASDAPPYTLDAEETDALLYLASTQELIKGELAEEVRTFLRDLYFATNDLRPALARHLPRMAARVRRYFAEVGFRNHIVPREKREEDGDEEEA